MDMVEASEGERKAPCDEYPAAARMVCDELQQVSIECPEAARIAPNKCMITSEGRDFFHISADMRGTFGKAYDTAARVKIGQVLVVSAGTKDEKAQVDAEALRRTRFKLAERQKVHVSSHFDFTKYVITGQSSTGQPDVENKSEAVSLRKVVDGKVDGLGPACMKGAESDSTEPRLDHLLEERGLLHRIAGTVRRLRLGGVRSPSVLPNLLAVQASRCGPIGHKLSDGVFVLLLGLAQILSASFQVRATSCRLWRTRWI